MTGRTLAALAALAALSGCGSLGIQDDAPARIDAALQAYAQSLRAHDADRAAAAFAADAELQAPGGDWLKTPDAIRKHLGELVAPQTFEIEMKGVSLQLIGAGALQTGTYRGRGGSAGKAVEGKFEAEWERQENGSWLISRLTFAPAPFTPTDVGSVP